MKNNLKEDLKYILIYKKFDFFTTNYITAKFPTIEDLEMYLDTENVIKNDIVYLGEYKPLKYKINLG